MRLEQKPDIEARATTVSVPEAPPDAGTQLQAAREADTVWRTARRDHFLGRLAGLQRRAAWTKSWPVALVLVYLLVGILTAVGLARSPAEGDAAVRARLISLSSVAAYCVLSPLVVLLCGCLLHVWLTVERRCIHARAAAEGVDLDT